MANWTEREINTAIKCLKKSQNIREALELMKKEGYDRSYDSLTSFFKSKGGTNIHLGQDIQLSNHTDIETNAADHLITKMVSHMQTIKKNGQKDIDVIHLSNFLDISPQKCKKLIELAREKGYVINLTNNDIHSKVIPVNRESIYHLPIQIINKEFIFGIMSDLHFGSKYSRPECMKDFVEMAYEAGVRHIGIPGDLVDGMRVYPGQEYELAGDGHGLEAQIALAKKHLPYKKGLTYHVVNGNHDYSFFRQASMDPCKLLSLERDDVKSYGWYSAQFRVENVDIEIHHPDKVPSYALSYNLQREIDAMPGGMKPDLTFYGHTHQMLYMPGYRNLHAFYASSFQDSTPYLRRKHIHSVVGGWIIKVGVTKDGSVKQVTPSAITYFQGVRKILQ